MTRLAQMNATVSLLLASALAVSAARANGTPPTPVATVASPQRNRAYVMSALGDVRVMRVAETTWRPLTLPTVLIEGDFIRTGRRSYATVRDAQGVVYRIRPETIFELPRRGFGLRFVH